jgi:hypothetical protein
MLRSGRDVFVVDALGLAPVRTHCALEMSTLSWERNKWSSMRSCERLEGVVAEQILRRP